MTNSTAQELGHAGVSTDLAHQSFNLVDELQALLLVLFALSVLLLKQPSAFGRLRRNAQNLRKRSKFGRAGRDKAHLLCHLLQHLCALVLPPLPFIFDLEQQRLRRNPSRPSVGCGMGPAAAAAAAAGTIRC